MNSWQTDAERELRRLKYARVVIVVGAVLVVIGTIGKLLGL